MSSDFDVSKACLGVNVINCLWHAEIQAARGAPDYIIDGTLDQAYRRAIEFLEPERSIFIGKVELTRKQIYDEN